MKNKILLFFLLLLCWFMNPICANANYEDDDYYDDENVCTEHEFKECESYYEDNKDGTHTLVMYLDCTKCREEKIEEIVENCDYKQYEDDFYEFDKGSDYHYKTIYYECPKCWGSKTEEIKENCTFKKYETSYEATKDLDYHNKVEYYECSVCENGKYITTKEKCDLLKYDDYTYKKISGTKTHNKFTTYECKKCCKEKKVKSVEKCKFETYVSEHDEKNHKIQKTCSLCNNSITKKENHTIKWVREGNLYIYRCNECSFTPLFNGLMFADENILDNYILDKNNTYTFSDSYYNSKINKYKKLKSSNKKICSISFKNGKVYLKAKKKGECKLTLYRQSGAKTTLKITVK